MAVFLIACVFVQFFLYKDTQDVGSGRRQGPLMVSEQVPFSSQPQVFKPWKLFRRFKKAQH